MGKALIFLVNSSPALQQPSSRVLQACHRLTLPKRYPLCSVDHVVEWLVMEDLEEGELLGQQIKLIYQDEETVVTVNAITLLSVVHDQV